MKLNMTDEINQHRNKTAFKTFPKASFNIRNFMIEKAHYDTL